MSLKRPPLSIVDIFQPTCVMNDPYPFLHQLRSRGPLYWDERLEGWVTTTYEACLAILCDQRFSPATVSLDTSCIPENARVALERFQSMLSQTMFLNDPPEQTRLRSLFASAFSPGAVKQKRAHIQALANHLLDQVVHRGYLDVLYDFAYPLIERTLTSLFSLSQEEDHQQIIQWSQDIEFFLVEGLPSGERALACLQSASRLTEYVHAVIKNRTRAPQDDFLQRMLTICQQERKLNAEEVLGHFTIFLFAGIIPMAQTITTNFFVLLTHPSHYRLFLENPALLSSAHEELLRYDSVGLRTQRTARADLELYGQQIRVGQFLSVNIAAANRDPQAFPDPDRLDLGRQGKKHLTFSHGPHFCFGAALSRQIGEIALDTLARRLPAPRIVRAERQVRQFSRNFNLLEVSFQAPLNLLPFTAH